MILERLLRVVVPTPDARFVPSPRALGPGVWSIDRRVRLGGASLPSRSTLVDVGAGRLVLISPPADVTDEVDGLGALSAIVAPSSFHYLHAEPWLRRHPTAGFFVAPELAGRVPALAPAIELVADSTSPWPEQLSHVVLGPDRGIAEVLFFHHPSRTLILTDLASNLVDASRLDRLAYRLAGMPRGFGHTRNSRRLLLREAANARAVLRAVMAWPFERIVMAHGAIVERDAQRTFRSAFARYL